MRTDAEDQAMVIANAKFFTSVAFRGQGCYERIDSSSLEQARKMASVLYTNRPILIYAVAYDLDGASVRQVHVENWEPEKKGVAYAAV